MKINVLLSTYNGELYIAEQLDSLLRQTVIDNMKIIIRDDGSTDSTLKIIEEYKSKNSNIIFYRGENLKPAKSFWHLLQNCDEADYFAFCDQDDVWDEDKLEVAINQLKEHDDVPALYFSDARVVDSELNLLSETVTHEKFLINYPQSLLGNMYPGCTYVFNKKTWELCKQLDVTNLDFDIHDWTVYKIVACFGKVIFDKQAHISYRQHGHNSIGASIGIKRLFHMFKIFDKKTRGRRRKNALILENAYGDMMSEENKKITHAVAHYSSDKKCKKFIIHSELFKFPSIKYHLFMLLVRINVL